MARAPYIDMETLDSIREDPSPYNHVIRLVAALQIGIESEEGEATLAPCLERYPAPHQVGRWR